VSPEFPVITGLGLVTPLGVDVQQTWARLLAGECIRTHSSALLPAERGISRINQLARAAAAQAVAQAGWTLNASTSDTAILVGTRKGDVTTWLDSLTKSTGGCNSACLGLGDTAFDLAMHLNCPRAVRLTMSAACSSGLHALLRGCMMIAGGEVRRAVLVAVESSLHPLFVASFNRLGILADESAGCRPFDRQRGGFFMSEAAAAVCIEGQAGCLNPPIAAIERFGLGSDALHITASDPDARTLRRLLTDVLAGPVDLVHAHGTGTEANDGVELAAIDDVVSCAPDAAVYSHKAALGHSLGAAGLISVVINCLAHVHGTIPPNAQTRSPLPTKNVRIDRTVVQCQVNRSLALASGFGGPAAVVALGKA
jgi:3-oxoacyl-[acyl-carrier-protein] synthase II